MENIKQQIAYKFRLLRNEKGVSQQIIADILGLTKSAYTQKENGKIGFSSEELMLLKNYYQLDSLDYIFGLEETQNRVEEEKDNLISSYQTENQRLKQEIETLMQVIERLAGKS